MFYKKYSLGTLAWLPICAFQTAAFAQATDRIDVSLETRQKLQWLQNDQFSGANEQQYHQRWLGGVHWTLTPHQVVYAQVNVSSQAAQHGPHSPQEHNLADLQQGYWQVMDLIPGELRVGRQVWSIELQRQLGSREGTNVRRSFDGLFWTLSSDSLAKSRCSVESTSVYHGWHVQPKTGLFNDRAVGEQSVSVVTQTYHYDISQQLYWHYIRARDNRIQHDAQSTALRRAELRHVLTLGSRTEKSLPVWHHAEFATQRGDRAGERLESWWAYGRLTGSIANLRPFVGFSYASGDKDPDDTNDQRFAPLFAKSPFYTEAGVIATTNIRSLQLGLSWHPEDQPAFDLDVQHLKKIRTNDKLYSTSGADLANSLAGANEQGWAINLSAQWQMTTTSELELVFSKLWHHIDSMKDVERVNQSLTFAELIWHYRFF